VFRKPYYSATKKTGINCVRSIEKKVMFLSKIFLDRNNTIASLFRTQYTPDFLIAEYYGLRYTIFWVTEDLASLGSIWFLNVPTALGSYNYRFSFATFSQHNLDIFRHLNCPWSKNREKNARQRNLLTSDQSHLLFMNRTESEVLVATGMVKVFVYWNNLRQYRVGEVDFWVTISYSLQLMGKIILRLK
jgi:hypothetical protein